MHTIFAGGHAAKRTSHVVRNLVVTAVLLSARSLLKAQSTDYRFSFPDRVHHVVEVEATFHDVPPGPLLIEVAHSSPGRYAAFNFVENIYGERITDADARALQITHPTTNSWLVAGHSGTVRMVYKVFGDRVDGTFFAVDTTHAHINLPAVLAWAKGLDQRSSRVTFDLPSGEGWGVGTQLYPTSDPTTFTAPNLTYLMDSPVELGHFATRTVQIEPRGPGEKPHTIRFVVHAEVTEQKLDTYVANVQKVIREEQAVFGELPEFEPGYYTFLIDYSPVNARDGMEHRNSTVITSRYQLDPVRSVGTAAHEFFHLWNVRRIRPASLEPFNFEDVNVSGELWFAEGFTNYYERLAMLRSGLMDLAFGLTQMGGETSYILNAPGPRFRSAVDMSRLAAFVDGATSVEQTDFDNTFASYYSFGDALAVGLDLTLRARSDSRITLDDYMQAMWHRFGKPGGSAPGLVRKPYTMADLRQCLAEVSGDPTFAADFFRRYVEGTERIDYAPLFLKAGLLFQKGTKASLGALDTEKAEGGLRIASPTVIGSPAYVAGLDLDDELLSIAGQAVSSPDDVTKILAEHKPGETVLLVFKRQGKNAQAQANLAANPAMTLVPVEASGTLTKEQRHFRAAWLSSRAGK